ncbi:MAG: Helix-turn-helix protein, partial [Chthonomonadales bacterium]|nr:Helix-turn-helix protein [Chthonomonadales bacterium]
RWELESILAVLELTPQERVYALGLLPTPRGISLSRQEAQASVAQSVDLGPMPMLGDLLQAMRLRRGLSQSQMATALKIARTTILRWETTETLPSEENLERICALLEAYPEEHTALSGRRIQVGRETSGPSLEEFAIQVDALDAQSTSLQTPLIDLHALTLKRQLWPLANRSQEASHLLARVQLLHSGWLMLHERQAEAEICIQRSLNSLRSHKAAKPFWQAAVNLAALIAHERKGGNLASIRVIKQWLPAFPRELQATLWCDLALYAGRAQQHQEANAYLTDAQEVLPYSADLQGMTEHYYPLTFSRILIAAGRPLEAMVWLPTVPDATHAATSRSAYQLLWIEAFLAAGERDRAQACMDQLRTLFAEYPQPSRQRKFQALAARL